MKKSRVYFDNMDGEAAKIWDVNKKLEVKEMIDESGAFFIACTTQEKGVKSLVHITSINDCLIILQCMSEMANDLMDELERKMNLYE